MKSRSETLDRFVEAFLFYAIMDYSKNLDLADIKYFCEFDKVWKIEQWLDVVGYEGYYKVSDLGRVKSLSRSVKGKKCFYIKNEKILVPIYGLRGRYMISFSVDRKYKKRPIHQLVAESFLNHTPCGYKLVVNHKDFNPLNNSVSNLEIVSQRINANKKHIKSKSKYVGVGFMPKINKWIARIVVEKKRVYLGVFEKEIEAHFAYQNKLKEVTK